MCDWIINPIYLYCLCHITQLPAEIFLGVLTSLPLGSPVSSSLSISLWLCHCARLVTEKVQCSVCPQRGGGKRIWWMHIASLYIHDYFLESIRKTWLIQVEVLIEVLSVSAVDFPSFIFQYTPPLPSLSFSVGLISVLPISFTLFFYPTLLSSHSGVLHVIGCDTLYPIRHHLAQSGCMRVRVLTLYELLMSDGLVVTLIYYGSQGKWCFDDFSPVVARPPAFLWGLHYAFTALQDYSGEPNSSA